MLKMIVRVLALLLLSFNLTAAPKKSSKKIAKRTIVIDPGHGGLDLGARSKSPYCEEKRICLSTALLVRKYLDQLGYKVILTRSTDVFIPLSRRVKIAHPSRVSLFVSLHYNSSSNSTAHGIEIFYNDSKKQKAKSKASIKLADNILKDMVHRTKARSRGVKRGNFYVIRETKVPAVLIEGGFISNPNERAKLRSRAYIDKIARSIANGIDKYYKST